MSPRPIARLRRVVRALAVSAVTIVAAAAALSGGLGCQPPASAGEGDTDGEAAPTPVVVSPVIAGPIQATIVAASTIEPERMVQVLAESTGRISLLEAEEGDAIEAGALIVKIKQDMQRSGLDRATTNLAKTKQDLEVVKKLQQAGAASTEELRAAELAFDSANLDVKDRKRDVSNTRVTAPLAGTVTERFVVEGAYVSAGAPLVTIIDFASLVARVYVPEKELDRIAVGQTAQIAGKAATGRRGEGTVLRIAPVVDATTGTVKVTVALPPALAGGTQGFLPGMYAEVTLVTQQRERAVLVDKQAIVYRDEQAFVFVLRGDRVEERELKLGLTNDDSAEVLSGLSLGDEVVVSGQASLENDGLVRRVDPTGRAIEASAAPGDDVAKRDAPKQDSGGA